MIYPKSLMNEEIHASFWDHLEELRAVLIRIFVFLFIGLSIALYFHQEMVQLVLSLLPGTPLFLFSPAEGFIAVFRLSFWLGLLGSSPFWLGSLIRFFLPGLRGSEKKWLPAFILLSILFIGIGMFLCLIGTLPLATEYLFTFNQTIGSNLWGFGAYLDFVLMLLFAHGCAFEMGAVLFFLIHIGAISGETLAKKRRHAIVASLIIGAVLTPPDVLTQLCIALPLMGFYECAILYSYFTRT
jgi:sec-independent protein translocase protein TatC